MDETPSAEQWCLHLASRAMQAEKPEDLKFVIANETAQLAKYRQAAFFDANDAGRLLLSCVSGLVSVTDSSPYTVWLNRLAAGIDSSLPHQVLEFSNAEEDVQEGWKEWLPSHLLVLPLKSAQGDLLGVSLFARDEAWTPAEIHQMAHLHQTYAYCLEALQRKSGRLGSWLQQGAWRKRPAYVAIALVCLMLVPVRLSALASAEVVALDAYSVAAPQDGVVHSFQVQPGAAVKRGEVLFTLDDTSILNRHEVAYKALSTAKAEALVAEQRAFDDVRGKAALAASIGKVREKEAELAAVKALMARIEIRAERDGVAIFADASDWIGRPVQTGERILQLADPKDAGLLMWLPVRDALNIDVGAPVKLFLHTKPLEPLEARILRTSYQVNLSPENIASYRLKGAFTEGTPLPRIGLRGTARISGEWSVLGYYIFRRPIAAVREWVGF